MVQPTRPFVDVSLNGRATKALYNSGVDISCISDEEFRKIPIERRPGRQGGSNPLRYIGAGGQPLDVRGTYILPIQILGRQVQHPFQVIRGLHEKVILGADFINEQLLGYDPCRREVRWTGGEKNNSNLRLTAVITDPEFFSRAVQLRTGLEKRQHVVAGIFREDCPHLAGGPGSVQTNEEGKCLVELLNTGSEPISLEHNQAIGQSKALQQGRLQAIDNRLVEAIVSKEATRGRGSPTLTKDRGENILGAAQLPLSVDLKRRYEELILKHHNVFSLTTKDSGYNYGKLPETALKAFRQLQSLLCSETVLSHPRKGSKMPDDFLSRNAVDAIGLNLKSFALEPDKDDFLGALRLFLSNRILPQNENLGRLVTRSADDCFVQNGILWKRLDKQHNFRQVLLVPPHLKNKIISEAHGQELGEHFGVFKTKEKILDSYFWPNMDTVIQSFLQEKKTTALQRLAEARKIVIENNLLATEGYKENFDKEATCRQCHPGQWVPRNEINFLISNKKMSPKFTGLFKISRLTNEWNIKIVVNKGRKMIANVLRLRPFFGSVDGDNDFPAPRGGRGADEDANENIISCRDTHTHSMDVLIPRHTRSLSKGDRPEPVGPSAHTRARVGEQQQQQQDRPLLFQVQLDSKRLADQNVTTVSSQQKKKKVIQQHLDNQLDPFCYSCGCKANLHIEAHTGLDIQLGKQQQHLYHSCRSGCETSAQKKETTPTSTMKPTTLTTGHRRAALVAMKVRGPKGPLGITNPAHTA